MTDQAVVAEGDTAPDQRAPTGRSAAAGLLAMVVVAALLGAVIALVIARDDARSADRVTVTVPVDASAGIRAGDLDVIDPIIRLEPGQDLVLVNQDWTPHTLGPLTAARGAESQLTYPTEGRHVLSTSLRSDGRVTVLVVAPGS